MKQITIDDITQKRFPCQRYVGYQFKINGTPMEVVISNDTMLAIYDIRCEKIYPLRFVS